MMETRLNEFMSRHGHSSRSRHSIFRRFGSNDDESTKIIGLAIGVILALAVLAGLGLVVRGLF